MENKMFCFQCEQTAGCSGCTGNAGVCGKTAETANLQDELTGALIGLTKACESNPHDDMRLFQIAAYVQQSVGTRMIMMLQKSGMNRRIYVHLNHLFFLV